jgi:hypothetical protein
MEPSFIEAYLNFNKAHKTGIHDEPDSVYHTAQYREDVNYTIDDRGEVRVLGTVPPPEELRHACLEVLPDGVTARWQHLKCLPADSRGWDQISYIQTDDNGSYAVCFLDSTPTGENDTYRAKYSFVSRYHQTEHPAGSIVWLKSPATTIPPAPISSLLHHKLEQ